MLFLKYVLLVVGIGMFVTAAAIVASDAWLIIQYRRKTALGAVAVEPQPVRWRTTVALACLAWAPLLIALSIAVVPSGMAGVRVSQTRGTLSGTLYPGVHAVTPLVEHLEVFDMRDKLFTTGGSEFKPGDLKTTKPAEPLKVQAKEGLTLGLAITVRTGSIPSGSTTSRAIFRNPSKPNWFPQSWPVHGENWPPTTAFATFSAQSAKRFASMRLMPSRKGLPPTALS